MGIRVRFTFVSFCQNLLKISRQQVQCGQIPRVQIRTRWFRWVPWVYRNLGWHIDCCILDWHWLRIRFRLGGWQQLLRFCFSNGCTNNLQENKIESSIIQMEIYAHSVWKLLKISHFVFIFGIFHQFVLLKVTYLVTLFFRKFIIFKMDIFWHF